MSRSPLDIIIISRNHLTDDIPPLTERDCVPPSELSCSRNNRIGGGNYIPLSVVSISLLLPIIRMPSMDVDLPWTSGLHWGVCALLARTEMESQTDRGRSALAMSNCSGVVGRLVDDALVYCGNWCGSIQLDTLGGVA